MPGTLIVGFDKTEASQRALAFAAAAAKATGATIHVVHILEWSPYSFLTAQELEERHKRRTEELARAAELISTGDRKPRRPRTSPSPATCAMGMRPN